VTHGQCDARPTVTFPAAGHHRPLTGTKLYCLLTEAHACERLAQGCYLKVGSRTRDLLSHKSNALTSTPAVLLFQIQEMGTTEKTYDGHVPGSSWTVVLFSLCALQMEQIFRSKAAHSHYTACHCYHRGLFAISVTGSICLSYLLFIFMKLLCFQCFDTVGWATGRAPGL